jgi:hypothetical protein
MVSGQGPNADTRAGCPEYSEFPPDTTAKADDLVDGAGCVYPETALTIGDQVSASGHVWKAYIAGMGNAPCLHPNSNALDDVPLSGSQPGYDTRHNPFIYFHSLLDLGDCENDDVDLSQLPGDLAKRSRTATLSYVAPGICAEPASVLATTASSAATRTTTTATSTPLTTTTTTTTATSTPLASATASTTTGTTTTAPAGAAAATTTTSTTPATGTTSTTSTTSDASAAAALASCQVSGPVGIAAENAFLQTWVPRILRSAAYKQDGVLVIAFAPAGLMAGNGQARTGALVLSRYIRRATTISTPYDAYSLLRSVEDMLNYTPLAHAGTAASFAAAVLG